MDAPLPVTGSVDLLHTLSPHIPDALINQLLPPTPGPGRRPAFTASQLWRLHLLALLTPAHSVNLLVRLLPEQREWRRFAHLPNSRRLPSVRLLHAFRARTGTGGLRRINEALLSPVLDALPADARTVALIDATDLPAATRGFKKRLRDNTRPSGRRSAPAR